MLEVKRPGEPAHSHEGKDVPMWQILGGTVAFMVFIAVVALLVAWLYQYLGETTPAVSGLNAPLAGPMKVPPPPRLQTNEPLDLKNFQNYENSVLESYGLVDETTGTVRIPIDRAIELTAQRGLPARPMPPPAPTSAPYTTQSSGVASAPGSTQYVPGPGPYADSPPAPGAIPHNGHMVIPPIHGVGKP